MHNNLSGNIGVGSVGSQDCFVGKFDAILDRFCMNDEDVAKNSLKIHGDQGRSSDIYAEDNRIRSHEDRRI